MDNIKNIKLLVEKSWLWSKKTLYSIYTTLKLDEALYFAYFLAHRYHVEQFDPRHIAYNTKVLLSLQSPTGLSTTRNGRFILLKTPLQRAVFWVKNVLFFGAYQSRVEKTVSYTFLALSLELNNPFSRDVLKQFLSRKLKFLKKLANKLKTLNGKHWDQSEIVKNVSIFEKNSLLQDQIIRSMSVTLKRQKESTLIKEGVRGIAKGIQPILSPIGASGAYWIRGTNREVLGLFKPYDEELYAPNNPIGPDYQGTLGLRRARWGCRVGESAHHEVAAFETDSFLGFGIVPRTYYASFTHSLFHHAHEHPFLLRSYDKTKIGSFQEFLEGFESVMNIDMEEASALPLEEFQLLVLLDVIIGNTDRNWGNVLVGDEKIAAIDHGLCFTDTTIELSYGYWAYFPQGTEPLHQNFIDLLRHFPFEKLAWRLHKRCFIQWPALQRMEERIALFLAAIEAGFVPHDLIDFMTPLYLDPLKDLKQSLNTAARAQVELYSRLRVL